MNSRVVSPDGIVLNAKQGAWPSQKDASSSSDEHPKDLLESWMVRQEATSFLEKAISDAVEPLKASLDRIEKALHRSLPHVKDSDRLHSPPLDEEMKNVACTPTDLSPSSDVRKQKPVAESGLMKGSTMEFVRTETIHAVFGSEKTSNVVRTLLRTGVSQAHHSVGPCRICGKLKRIDEVCINCGAPVQRQTVRDHFKKLWQNSCLYWKCKSSGPAKPRGACARLVASQWFESLCGVVIVLNSVSIGYSSEYAIHHLDEPTNPFIYVSELFFVTFYSLEVLLKLAAHRCWYISGDDWRWNVFDMLLIVVAIYEFLHNSVKTGGSNGNNITFIRLIRLLKLVKIFRIFRIMRFFHELRILLYSIAVSCRSLFWTAVLLTVVIYIFALIFVQGVTGHLTDHQQITVRDDLLVLHWGGVETAMSSLYKASTGGVDWGEIADPLKVIPLEISAGFCTYFSVFMCYTAFLHFAVLNILTGVFVENALKTSKQDKKNMIHEERRSQQCLVTNMINLFHSFDDNDTGTISVDEFEKHQSRPEVRAYFAQLDLDVSDLWQFMKTLSDMSPNEGVEIEAFVEGCLRMRGSARRADFVWMTLETARISKSLEHFKAFTQEKLEEMEMISRAVVENCHHISSAVEQLSLNKPASQGSPVRGWGHAMPALASSTSVGVAIPGGLSGSFVNLGSGNRLERWPVSSSPGNDMENDSEIKEALGLRALSGRILDLREQA